MKTRSYSRYIACLFYSVFLLFNKGFGVDYDSAEWEGDVDKFSFGESICLSDEKEGVSFIFTDHQLINDWNCELDVSLLFSPSASNKFEVVFWSDSSSLLLAQNALYGKLGASGGARLFRFLH